MKIIESTDGKRLGEEIFIVNKMVTFDDGEVFIFDYLRQDDDSIVLANSNYQIRAV